MLVRAAARQFIRRYVGANDMVAVVTTGGSDRRAARSSRAAARACWPRSTSSSGRRSRRDGDPDTASASFRAAQHLRDARATSPITLDRRIRGRRKAIVWFGEGVDYNIDNPFVSRDADVIRSAMQDAIAAATRANVSFYGVDARGVGAGLDEAIDISGDARRDQRLARRSRTRCAGRRTASRIVSEETGGFADRQPERSERGLRADRPGEQQLLPARVLRLQPTARRPVPQRARCA